MNGPGHFARSEKLLISTLSGGMQRADLYVMATLKAAQVHATLALAAATADAAVRRYVGNENVTDRAWAETIS